MRKLLGLDDLRRNKEDQLLVVGVDRGVLEQVAKYRDAAEQRNLGNGHVVVYLDHATDGDGLSVVDQHLRGGLLSLQRRVQLRTGDAAEVRHGVLNINVEEDGLFRCDLRCNRKPQEGVNVSYGWRSTQLGLRDYRDSGTLFHQRGDIVLRHDARTGQYLQQASAFRHSQDKVQTIDGRGVDQ